MNTLKTITASISVISASLLFSTSANAMDPKIESALIEVCKSAQHNNVISMRKTIKSHRLNEQTVASKVMCNGENIIGFAETHGSYKTAAHLNKRLGDRQIVDLAQVYSVTF